MPFLTFVRSIPTKFMVGFIQGYQKIISPHMPSSCRFSPTCSDYSIEALRKYGLVKGVILATHRLLRCHPWGGHGYDPPVWYSERPDSADGASENQALS